jgi:hypothetical protein
MSFEIYFKPLHILYAILSFAVLGLAVCWYVQKLQGKCWGICDWEYLVFAPIGMFVVVLAIDLSCPDHTKSYIDATLPQPWNDIYCKYIECDTLEMKCEFLKAAATTTNVLLDEEAVDVFRNAYRYTNDNQIIAVILYSNTKDKKEQMMSKIQEKLAEIGLKPK